MEIALTALAIIIAAASIYIVGVCVGRGRARNDIIEHTEDTEWILSTQEVRGLTRAAQIASGSRWMSRGAS